jgi:hypothetical protein
LNHGEEWRRFKKEMREHGWTIHPSVDRLRPGDRVPSFSVRYVKEALAGRISFTQNLLNVLGEEPEGCRKYLSVHRTLSSSSSSTKRSDLKLRNTFSSCHFCAI